MTWICPTVERRWAAKNYVIGLTRKYLVIAERGGRKQSGEREERNNDDGDNDEDDNDDDENDADDEEDDKSAHAPQENDILRRK